MGNVRLLFDPRNSLADFASSTGKVSLVKRVSGKKNSPNMAIWGENLATLAALKSGSGTAGSPLKVDIITIDPPYNVGGEQTYKNEWKGMSERERDWAGDHGAFLDFMEPRLKIGRSLLKEEGVMFVHICDLEFARLKILMDEIFHEENYMGTFIWDKGQGSPGSHMTDAHEFILVYAKNAKKASKLLVEKPSAKLMLEMAAELKKQKISHGEAQERYQKWLSENKSNMTGGESAYKMLHPQTFEPLQVGPSCAQTKRESRCKRPILHPVTKKMCPVPANGWKWSEETLLKLSKFDKPVIGEGFVIGGSLIFGEDETTVPRRVMFLKDNMFQKMSSVIKNSYGGDKDLPSGLTFSTPKPVSLIKAYLRAIRKTDAVVLDYFAGSGATAHAVHELNDEDNGTRSWIMIEEMGSTFHKVLVPRLHHISSDMDFGIFELHTATVNDRQLLKTFQQYSLDFLTSYHAIDDGNGTVKHGLHVLGLDRRKEQLIALAVHDKKESRKNFASELAALVSEIKKNKASSTIVYCVQAEDGGPSPWLEVTEKDLKGTSCEQLSIIAVPEQLLEEWNDVLTAMSAA